MSERNSMETLTFLFVFFREVDTYSLILSIHIAENAMTMIMTTVLLCFKGFFRKFLGGFFYGWLADKPQFLQPVVGLP